MVSIVIYILIALVLLLDGFAIYASARRADYSAAQKCAHMLIALILPLLGAIGFIVFYRSIDAQATKAKPEFGGGNANSNFVSNSNINGDS